jgi:nucleoside-diphosphate-sugar epimerase
MRVFVAGGTGVIGRRLVPQLVARGHQVTATTTSAAKLGVLERMGAAAVVMNGLDAVSIGEAVAGARPDAIVHQMTAINPAHAGKPDMKHFDRWFATTSRLRTEGTDHLLAAARAAGVSAFVAQGYASWNGIREGGWVKTEEDPLDLLVGTSAQRGMEALRHLEGAVVKAGGAVLRYGSLYGPGATDDLVTLVRKRQLPLVGDGSGYCSWVHVDDAASAAVLAVEQHAKGVFDIVDDEPAPASQWLPYLAECAGAKRPIRVPRWLARMLAGDPAVIMMTEGRGFSNVKARRELGWEPRYPSWREGFREPSGDPERESGELSERAVHGLQLGQCLARDLGEFLLVGRVDPAAVGMAQGQEADHRGQARGGVFQAARLQRTGYGGDKAGLLDRFALAQLRVGGDDRLALQRELAALGRERLGRGVERGGDGLQRRGAIGSGGDRVGEGTVKDVLADEQHLAFVGNVAEERALGQPCPLGDLDHGRVLVALLGEQLKCGAHEARPGVRLPAGHAPQST